MTNQKPSPIITSRRHLWLLFSFIVCFSLSLWVNYNFPRPILPALFPDHSAAFYGRHIADPLYPPSPSEIIHLTPSTPFLFTPPQAHLSLQFDFWLRCPDSCPIVWLEIGHQSQVDQSLLINHPLFDSLNWPYLSLSGLNLYQPHLIYTSLDSLFASKPFPSLLTESSLVKKLPLPRTSLTFLETETSISSQSAILTTYLPPGHVGSWLLVKRTVTSTLASEMFWQLAVSPPITLEIARPTISLPDTSTFN